VAVITKLRTRSGVVNLGEARVTRADELESVVAVAGVTPASFMAAKR